MYVKVEYKDPPRKKGQGDTDIIECYRFQSGMQRLNFFRTNQTSSMFLSIALDQLAIWEIVEKPEDVPPPKPDNIVALPVPKSSLDLLKRGSYTLSQDEKYVTLPIFYRTP